MEVALLQHQYDLIDVALHHIRRRRRKRKRREVWVRPWIGRRRQFGLYDQLLVKLRQEDQKLFKNFMRMPPDMFDELLARVGPRITKQTTRYREPLEPGLKLALTLRHLASGSTYAAMKYGWRVPHNTQSLVVREVCKAIIDKYMPEVMTCPTTPEGWRAISDNFLQKWNFPHTCGALDGKHIACKCPPKSGSQYFNYKGFYSVVLMALVDADYKFVWADIGATGSASDAQIYNSSRNSLRMIPSDSLPQILYPMTTRMSHSSSSATMPSPYERPRWSHTASGVWTMKRGYLTTGFPAPGGWLKMPSASWRTASRFCWLRCSITPPLSRSSWKPALSYTIWWGYGTLDSKTSSSTVQKTLTVISSLEHGDKTGTCKTRIQLLAVTPLPRK